MKIVRNLATAVILLLAAGTLSSCDNGSSSTGGSGITCNELAGSYSTPVVMPDGKRDYMYINVQNDCTFSTQSSLTGKSSGVFTSKNNNTFYGRGVNAKYCGGPFSVTASLLNNGGFTFNSDCDK